MKWIGHAMLALSLLVAAGCRNDAKRREQVAGDLEALTQDSCMKGWLTDARRRRVIARARDGRISKEAVDAYLDELREKIREGEEARMSNETFCRAHRNLFRHHFLR